MVTEKTKVNPETCVHHSTCKDIGGGRVEQHCILCDQTVIVTPRYLKTQIPVGFNGNFDDSLHPFANLDKPLLAEKAG